MCIASGPQMSYQPSNDCEATPDRRLQSAVLPSTIAHAGAKRKQDFGRLKARSTPGMAKYSGLFSVALEGHWA